jgi:acyl carrier protein
MAEGQLIEDRIQEFVLKQFPLARKNGVRAEEKWLENGMLDSLGILDLVHFLEGEFSICISDEDLLPENFQSLKAVVVFVQSKPQAHVRT